jgi:hypothetical protein
LLLNILPKNPSFVNSILKIQEKRIYEKFDIGMEKINFPAPSTPI